MARKIDWKREGKVAILTLDNPPVNQYGFEAMKDLGDCLEEIKKDPQVKVVVFTASGEKTFCGGADLKVVEDYFRNYRGANWELSDAGNAPQYVLAEFPKPTIAALNGHTFGGGLELAMCCDLRVASPHIKLGVTEVTLGMIPGGGGTQRLSRYVRYGKAIEMLLLGQRMTADEARKYGLINRIAPSKEELMDTAMELANEIAQYSSDSLYHIKKCAFYGVWHDIREGMAVERESFAEIYKGLGAREGVRAFFEKRKPDFTDL